MSDQFAQFGGVAFGVTDVAQIVGLHCVNQPCAAGCVHQQFSSGGMLAQAFDGQALHRPAVKIQAALRCQVGRVSQINQLGIVGYGGCAGRDRGDGMPGGCAEMPKTQRRAQMVHSLVGGFGHIAQCRCAALSRPFKGVCDQLATNAAPLQSRVNAQTTKPRFGWRKLTQPQQRYGRSAIGLAADE